MTRDQVETYLMPLIEAGLAVGEVPLLSSPEWAALDRHDPRRIAAVARAAMCWYLDGRPDAIRQRLTDELADIDLFKRYAVAEASRDVAVGYTSLSEESRNHVSFAERQRRRAAMLGMPVEEMGNTDFDPKYAITGEMDYADLSERRRKLTRHPPQLLQQGIDQLGATN